MITGRPDQTLDNTDPGDETYRRYRYQSTYAAIIAVSMIGTSSGVAEVFCEHHDDILVKRNNGKFYAIQVKTQQPGDLPFKSDDDPIRKALTKFLRHELRFGDQFERYTMATNHSFFRDKGNSKSLFSLCEMAKESLGGEIKSESRLWNFINSFIRKFNKGRSKNDKATFEKVRTLLCKLYPDDTLPKLDGIHRQLRDKIAECKGEYAECTHIDLERAANALSLETMNASSLFHAEATNIYLSLSPDPIEEETRKIIDGKRITPDRVEHIISDALHQRRRALMPIQPFDPATLPVDLTVAEKKMTAGGLSATTINAARDWYASAQYIQREWASKLGEEEALKRYNHIGTMVQTISAYAHELARVQGQPYGPKMLEEIRTGLTLRRNTGTDFFDCDEEHLLGHAVIRTEQCKTWWSESFSVD
jgi:hypothetical protein